MFHYLSRLVVLDHSVINKFLQNILRERMERRVCPQKTLLPRDLLQFTRSQHLMGRRVFLVSSGRGFGFGFLPFSRPLLDAARLGGRLECVA